MIVSCKISPSQCPYNVQGFCSKQTLGIDASGMCTVLWRKGQQKRVFFSEDMLDPRRPVIIEEGAVTEVTDAYEPNCEDEEDSSSGAIDQASPHLEESEGTKDEKAEQKE